MNESLSNFDQNYNGYFLVRNRVKISNVISHGIFRRLGIFQIFHGLSRKLLIKIKTSLDHFLALAPFFNLFITCSQNASFKNEQPKTVLTPSEQ